ncbi:MAG: molecular chaperone HtpG [Kiloniellales bacterium]
MTDQTLSFQAEVSRLLDIVANALYSNKEIFLRELISNASDACDRLRYAAITEPALTAEDPDFAIVLTLDKAARELTVADNGIGMSRDELIENLGTIARSGTAAFVQQLADKKADVTQIGQFGVGFYSAFMVADQVEVLSRRAGEKEGWHWVSDGKGSFTVGESEAAPARGTRIILHQKKGEDEFLDEARLRGIVKTYSDHIAIPIRLGGPQGDTLNDASAIWTRPRSEVSDEQYKEFYHHVGHSFDDPWLRLHFKAEGRIEYSALLYIPSTKPFDIFHPDRRHRVKLYVKRVFITDECEELVPSYLRFLRGVIDSEDLPLNISRELLQANPLLAKIRAGVVKRVLGALEKKAEKEPDDYAVFWNNFGPVLKEGLYEDNDQREALLKLCRFRSTHGDGPDGGKLISLDDYVGRMKEGQEAIYTISGDEHEALLRSPQLEGFRAKGVEVLLLTDPVDEFWLPAVGQYADKPFKSVTRGGADLGKVQAAAADDAEPTDKDEPAAEVDALIAFVRLTLKDQVKDVRVSERLTESAVCLVADESGFDLHLERLLKQHRQIEQATPRILEINPRHPLIRCLGARIGQEGAAAELEEVARLLLDQARILEGEPLPDPAAFARRLDAFVAKGLAGG